MIMMTMHFIKDENGKGRRCRSITRYDRSDSARRRPEDVQIQAGNVIDLLDMVVDGISLPELLENAPAT